MVGSDIVFAKTHVMCASTRHLVGQCSVLSRWVVSLRRKVLHDPGSQHIMQNARFSRIDVQWAGCIEIQSNGRISALIQFEMCAVRREQQQCSLRFVTRNGNLKVRLLVRQKLFYGHLLTM